MLSLALDVAQRRLKRDRIGITAAGLELDGTRYSNTWIDPQTNTAMLRPAVAFAGYHESGSGIYAKLRKSDLTLTSAAWRESEKLAVGDYWLEPVSSTNEKVNTTSTYGKNRGFVVSLFPFSPGNNQTAVLAEFGWSDTLDGTEGVSLRLYTSGAVEVWRDNEMRGTYSLGSIGGQFTDILLLPMRRRELLVWSPSAGSFVHVFTEIAEDDADPEIVPDAPFWLEIPNGRPVFQLAPARFNTSGYVTSLPVQLAEAPPTGATLETWSNDAPAAGVTNARILADPAFAGTTGISFAVRTATDSGAFTPNGTDRDCLAKVTLTGDGAYTPFLYGVHAAYSAEFVETDDSEEQDLSDWPMADNPPTLDVPDDAFGVRFDFEFNEPETKDAEIPNLLTSADRPFNLAINETPVLSGLSLPPEFVWGTDDVGSRAMMGVRDVAALLESYTFRERMPLDGLDLCKTTGDSAVRFILERAGLELADMDLEDVDFRIPEAPTREAGEWNWLIDVGDTAASVLQRLHETFAASFLMGARPTDTGIKFQFRDPDTLSATPVVILYPNPDYFPVTPGDYAMYGDFRANLLQVEANEVRVTGVDPRTGQPVQAYIEDAASKDPSTVPSLRPENWLGFPRVMGVLDPRITSQDAAVRCAEYLMPIVSARRYAAEWTCLLPVIEGVPLWRGDVVTLEGRGDYRVSSISMEFVTNYADLPWVKCRCTGVKVGTGSPFNLRGRDLASIVETNRLNAKNRVIRRSGWEDASRYLMGQVVAA